MGRVYRASPHPGHADPLPEALLPLAAGTDMTVPLFSVFLGGTVFVCNAVFNVPILDNDRNQRIIADSRLIFTCRMIG